MKKSIRFLAAGLAAACTLSLAALAAEPETPPAVDVVTELGIMEDRADGSFDPEGTVTREEMARMVCLLLNGGKDPNLQPQEKAFFPDTQGRALSGYVDYCANLGVVAGRGDGTFGPEEPLTGTAAAKMLLVCVGYTSDYERFQEHGNWDVNIGVRASEVGLFDGVDGDPKEPITRDMLARMMYNALTMPMIQYEYKPVPGEGGVMNPVAVPAPREDGRTLLGAKFRMELVDGALQALPEPEK